ncbi:unnamed protein product [Prunus armeniaca]
MIVNSSVNTLDWNIIANATVIVSGRCEIILDLLSLEINKLKLGSVGKYSNFNISLKTPIELTKSPT